MNRFGHSTIKYGLTLISALGLSSCGSQNDSIACTANVVPSLSVTLMDTSGSLNISLSDLDVIAINENGERYALTAQSPLSNVGFPTYVYTGPWEQEGRFIVHATYETDQLGTAKDIVVTSNACHVETQNVEIELYLSNTACEDGYAEVDTVCETLQGCAYPLWEERQTSGLIDGVSSIQCVNSCTLSQVTPGVCENVDLPSIAPLE